MARYEYPWDRLTRIGKKFIIDFKPGDTEKDKKKLERRLRAAASWQQTRKERVQYRVSIVIDETTGQRTGVSVERVKVDAKRDIRVE